MARAVYLDTIGRQTRMAVVEDGALVEFAVETRGERRLVGNVYLARVVNILRGMRAAFVDIGLDKNAFLSLDDMPSFVRDADEIRVNGAQKPLRPGQEVIVQVSREPGGGKGPRVTMNPSFPGKYTVLLPTVEAVGVSRRIEDGTKRAAFYGLAKELCPDGVGLVVRTAAEEASAEEIEADVRSLLDGWGMLAASAKTRRAPSLLFDDGGLAARAARDLLSPIHAGAFSDTLEHAIKKSLARRVWLDSGAFIVFDRTEAMHVVDVNSGKYTGGRSLGDTLRRLNMEAAREAARQIRLRDMGGIIVIDFVDMERDEDREAVLEAFREAQKPDRAKLHVHGFTGAGLLEMTRRPVYQQVPEALFAPCPCCHGEGRTPSADTVAHELLRDVRRRRMSGDDSEIVLAAPEEVLDKLRLAGVPERVSLKAEGALRASHPARARPEFTPFEEGDTP